MRVWGVRPRQGRDFNMKIGLVRRTRDRSALVWAPEPHGSDAAVVRTRVEFAFLRRFVAGATRGAWGRSPTPPARLR
ncbi:protein of unknown function [Burkholderia multivorans]